MTLAELIAARDQLRRARFTGVATIRLDDEEVTYKSDSQIAAALAAIEADIAAATRGARPRTFYPATSKGL